jgi:class 3 adenylate cyclase
VSRVEVRDLDQPEAVVSHTLGATHQVRLAGTVVSKHVLQPGWSWEKEAQPIVGTTSCELYHRGVVLSGRMGVRTDEGEEHIIGPDHVFDLMPGHVTWVEGDEQLVMVDWAGGAGFDTAPGSRDERVMASILFTDIVDSTARAAAMGDRTWRQLVDRQYEVARAEANRWAVQHIESTGDGIMATFDTPTRALRCAFGLRDAMAALELQIRVGIHTGEILRREEGVGGIGVHIAARVLAQAAPSKVLVTRTVRDLTAGTDLAFQPIGSVSLKGVPGEWELLEASLG